MLVDLGAGISGKQLAGVEEEPVLLQSCQSRRLPEWGRPEPALRGRRCLCETTAE